jgi:GT2 family glycosyltransferase
VIKATQSEFALLVNPDIEMQPDYLAAAMAAMQNDPAIGTVCGLLLQNEIDPSAAIVDGTGLTMSRSRRLILRDHGVVRSSACSQKGEIFGADGALPLYRRAMIEHISVNGQFFDELFFAHKEDHDVSWRSRLCGWKTVFTPESVALHPRVFRPGNLQLRQRLAPEIKYHAVKNDLLMLLKNEDPINFIKDFFHIAPRRVAIFCYALLFERSSLSAYSFVFKNRGNISRWRRQISRVRKMSSGQIRHSFHLGEKS